MIYRNATANHRLTMTTTGNLVLLAPGDTVESPTQVELDAGGLEPVTAPKADAAPKTERARRTADAQELGE